jgi:hypothetical protein
MWVVSLVNASEGGFRAFGHIFFKTKFDDRSSEIGIRVFTDGNFVAVEFFDELAEDCWGKVEATL